MFYCKYKEGFPFCWNFSNFQMISLYPISQMICVYQDELFLRISSLLLLSFLLKRSPLRPWLLFSSVSSELLSLYLRSKSLFLAPSDPTAYWVIIIFLALQWPSCVLDHNNSKQLPSTYSAGYHSKHSACMNSFSLHNNPGRKVLMLCSIFVDAFWAPQTHHVQKWCHNHCPETCTSFFSIFHILLNDTIRSFPPGTQT